MQHSLRLHAVRAGLYNRLIVLRREDIVAAFLEVGHHRCLTARYRLLVALSLDLL